MAGFEDPAQNCELFGVVGSIAGEFIRSVRFRSLRWREDHFGRGDYGMHFPLYSS